MPPSHGPRHDQLRDDLSQVVPWRNGVTTGAMAAGSTLCGWPSRVARVASGSTPASTWHAVLIQGVVVPSTTSVGTVTLLSCALGIEKSPRMSASYARQVASAAMASQNGAAFMPATMSAG